MVSGDKNTVKAQQGVDILAGAAVGHGNGFNGSGNGDNNNNNQQYVTGSRNTVIGTVYTSNNGVRSRAPRLCMRAALPSCARVQTSRAGAILTVERRLQDTGSLASLVSGTASIPLAGGSGSPVVANPSYVPPPNVAADNTDSNTHNNYQVVTGNDNIVVGKAVNTSVSQVGSPAPRRGAVTLACTACGTRKTIPMLAHSCQCPGLTLLPFSTPFCAP